MKAVILVAGIGSRLSPLTDHTPKALLPIGDNTTLGLMVDKLSRHGVESFIIVCGNMANQIRTYLAEHFPKLTFVYVTNERYRTTNTGYSLLLAGLHLGDETFLKLDGDVNFDEDIIVRLLATPDDASYVCVDKTAVDTEVIKVQCDETGRVIRIGNKIAVDSAAGESIGIEKISRTSAAALFSSLNSLMQDSANYQNYYEVAYDLIVQAGATFKVVDITGLNWVEMDNRADYDLALQHFATGASAL